MRNFLIAILTIFVLYGCTKTNTQTACDDFNSSKPHINCDGLVTDTLGTNDSAQIYVPSAFTPNGDGINDTWGISGRWIYSKNITIYDDNNNVIYNGDTPWAPGQIIDSQVAVKYYYKIQATTTAGHHIGKCGSVYMLTCIPRCLTDPLYYNSQLNSGGFDMNFPNDPIGYCN